MITLGTHLIDTYIYNETQSNKNLNNLINTGINKKNDKYMLHGNVQYDIIPV